MTGHLLCLTLVKWLLDLVLLVCLPGGRRAEKGVGRGGEL